MVYVKFKKLTGTAIAPTKGSANAAGYDLYVDTTEDIVVMPGETVPFYTGIAVEIPDGYYGAVVPRSGLSTKRGLRLPHCYGVIDSDYRGNVGVPLYNDNSSPQTVMAHERVAQIIFHKYEDAILTESETLSETERGAGGFGSSGRK